MLKKIGILLLLIVIACGGVVLFAKMRNPEKREMNEEARAGVPGKFVMLADGITHYDVAGPETGSRVVLVHGFSVPYYIWDSTSVALSNAGFRVARYDHFGRGYSDRPAVRYTARLYDRQLEQLLDSLGWRDPVHVVGLSMGGPVVAGFAAKHPERVKSLTLVDPAAGGEGGVPWYFRMPVFGRMMWQALAVPSMADGQLSDFYEPQKWPDWVDRYRPQVEFRGFGRALLSTRIESAHGPKDGVYAQAGKTGVPTLLIWGKEDQTVPIANAAVVQKGIPQVQFHPIEKAGHLPQMERTDVVNPLLIAFLHAADSSHAPAADSTKAKK